MIARQLGLPRLTVAVARDMVIEAAARRAGGDASPDSQQLTLALEGATGLAIAALAIEAQRWVDPSDV